MQTLSTSALSASQRPDSIPDTPVAPQIAASPPVALIRAEGVLWSGGLLRPTAYLAANAQGFGERAARLAGLALAAPLGWALRQNDRGTSLRATAFACRHMSEDRVVMLLEEYLGSRWMPQLQEEGLDIARRCERDGYRLVVLSELLDPVARHLVERLVEQLALRERVELVANRLEMQDGRATGRLVEPVVGESARVWQELAEQRGWDLRAARAYASAGPDGLLLAAVGDPCAVRPDYTLRQAARGARWPVVESVR